MQGWIKLHRSIMENPLYLEKPFDKGKAWIDLILMANHEDREFLLGTRMVKVDRGSFITSELKLMDRWGWSKEKVRRFLKLLEECGMIVKKSDRRKTVIILANYGFYQGRETESDHQETTDRPQGDYQQDTNKNVKNDNNVKNDIDVAAVGNGENHFYLSIKNKYLQRRGKGFEISAIDESVIEDLLREDIPLTTILEGIDKSFDEYNPKHKYDQINSLKYCLSIIYDLHFTKTQKVKRGGSKRARDREIDDKPFDKREYFSL